MRSIKLAGGALTILLLLGLALNSAWANTDRATSNTALLPSEQYTIKVVIEGVEVGPVVAISGLESEIEVVEYKHGDDNATLRDRKRPGRVKYANITLKRGLVSDPSFHEWYQKVLQGVTERKSGSIIYLDREGNEVLRYNFFEAWPCRWKAPELNAQDRHIVEEIEFVVERVERAK